MSTMPTECCILGLMSSKLTNQMEISSREIYNEKPRLFTMVIISNHMLLVLNIITDMT